MRWRDEAEGVSFRASSTEDDGRVSSGQLSEPGVNEGPRVSWGSDLATLSGGVSQFALLVRTVGGGEVWLRRKAGDVLFVR